MKMCKFAHALTTDDKKLLQAKFIEDLDDECYDANNNAKNKFEYKLKDGYVVILKQNKKKNLKNSFSI
jgi:hypothetical protein